MSLDLQYKIAMDVNLTRFLREYSHWYKYLNRSDDYFKDFVMDMKDKYGLKASDRFNKMLDNINMLQSFIDVFK